MLSGSGLAQPPDALAIVRNALASSRPIVPRADGPASHLGAIAVPASSSPLPTEDVHLCGQSIGRKRAVVPLERVLNGFVPIAPQVRDPIRLWRERFNPRAEPIYLSLRNHRARLLISLRL